MLVYEHLYERANKIKIIDTHEHLNPNSNLWTSDIKDFLHEYFSHYITSDLMSAGMPEDALHKVTGTNTGAGVEERFAILEPYLECVKNTSYYRSLTIATQKLYGIADINKNTIVDLNDKFIKSISNENRRYYIMKEVCNIDRSINDCWTSDIKGTTNELFVSVWHPDGMVDPDKKVDAATLDEWCEKYKTEYKRVKADGIAALKSTLAYQRSLYYEDVDKKRAEDLFNEYLRNDGKGGFPKELQDYIFHYALSLADEDNFIIQIHTGLQEGMGNDIRNANPILLSNLFNKYKNITFDLFHLGYPYEKELIVLAKYHPNVYVDLCWTHIISPEMVKKALYEMLDVIPYSKIFGFGGDYVFYDGVVGHLELAKRNICEVLAKKVENKEFTLDLAENILYAMLRGNAERVFFSAEGIKL